MAGVGVKKSGGGGGLYAVLGVATDCSDADLRAAYRKLAMKWHPDKCAAAGSSAAGAEAAKARFQKIQGAYAVLSDPNKRILYDVGAYDSDGDDDGTGEILGDILEAMSQAGPAEKGKGESLEEMQRQFEELFLRPSPSSFRSPVATACLLSLILSFPFLRRLFGRVDGCSRDWTMRSLTMMTCSLPSLSDKWPLSG
ncbi:hypothetical protein ACP4OV_018202 [Aristida adscensionis]